ncbi:hypothetical protein GWK47_000041 [Chionoecetes opilio]|uniref:Uncharacterized protein n=1 Tax=Chionoecetes opilio TaxID=41210 RepID=A0A8J4YDA8_CHIOP|nr:hypothetical protein GWK47_000041 [Chionoecetes opilio]
MMMQWCKKHSWATLLVAIGGTWMVATFLTAAGVYMVICHSLTPPWVPPTNSPRSTTLLKDHGLCRGSWWTQDGQVILIAGCLCNVFLLLPMLLYLVIERRLRTTRITKQEQPPPDYESLIREETPPPSYSNLNLAFSSSSTSLNHWTPMPPLMPNQPLTVV